MERNYDEVISDMLIQLADIESRWQLLDQRLEKADKRLDLTIKRMVKAESRLEAQEKRMEAFDKKLAQSIKEQREFASVQSKMNKYFLDIIKRNSSKS
jgi:chromosome segregation ATPase